MKKFLMLTILALTLTASQAFALPVDREFRDMKLPTQQLIEKQTITAPVVADADRLKDDLATSDSATTSVTSFLAQPDVCRNITITPGGTTTDVPAGDVTITGKNFFNQTITDTITFAANASTIGSGTKAFCSVSSIVFPIQDGAGATYDIGIGDALGLKRCMNKAGHVVFATFNGAYETTRPTCVADADEVEKNTCDINGTLDGTKDVEIFFFQNFRCFP